MAVPGVLYLRRHRPRHPYLRSPVARLGRCNAGMLHRVRGPSRGRSRTIWRSGGACMVRSGVHVAQREERVVEVLEGLAHDCQIKGLALQNHAGVHRMKVSELHLLFRAEKKKGGGS